VIVDTTKTIILQALFLLEKIFLIGANWLGSMLGYDKIKQAIKQIVGDKE